MYYKHNNITFDITPNINIGDDYGMGDINDSLGWCVYTYPEGLLKEFLLSDEAGRCIGFEEGNDTEESYNPDVFISFLDWYESKYPEKEITIKVEAQHPFWLFHDLCHSENNDVIGCEANITAWIERDRLQKGYDLMMNVSSYEFDDYTYLEIIEDSFYKRFKERLNLEDFCADRLMSILYEEEYGED